MSQMTVFSGRERRRRWSDEEQIRILAEAFLPGACVATVAHRNDISTSLIYQWRDKLRGDAVPRITTQIVAEQRWLAEFGHGYKWKPCLKAAMMPRIRSEHDKTSETNA